MRILISIASIIFTLTVSPIRSIAAESAPPATPEVKEWTFITFLNGNNNLDSFGKININQMEQVGSTPDINVVVQWASLANKKTQRLYIIQDSDTEKVTSPVLQDLGNADMGDWKNLVEFIQWSVVQFPAKHYFINVWDHGSGWHALKALENANSASNFRPMDISWDDNTGHSITTLQLAQVLSEAAKVIGHKVDLYASDACLMAMVEIAHEVSDSVDVYAGSEEVEPGSGWPYQTFLQKWAASPKSTAAQVSTLLTHEYVNSYNGGVNGQDDATFSAFDLSKIQPTYESIAKLAENLKQVSLPTKKEINKAISQTQNFTSRDYSDLYDFVSLLEKAQLADLDMNNLSQVKANLSDFVIAHANTPKFPRAWGTSIWLPRKMSIYNAYIKQYSELKFEAQTHWGEALHSLLQ
jgi:hypothetical protein